MSSQRSLGTCVNLGAIAGTPALFMVFGLIPFEAWRCAKGFLPAHTGLETVVAFCMAA
jgi:hypothetical protein